MFGLPIGGPIILEVSVTAGGTGSSVPLSENSQTLSPRGEPAKTLPAYKIATY